MEKVYINCIVDGVVKILSLPLSTYTKMQEAIEMWQRIDRIRAKQRSFRVKKSLLPWRSR